MEKDERAKKKLEQMERMIQTLQHLENIQRIKQFLFKFNCSLRIYANEEWCLQVVEMETDTVKYISQGNDILPVLHDVWVWIERMSNER